MRSICIIILSLCVSDVLGQGYVAPDTLDSYAGYSVTGRKSIYSFQRLQTHDIVVENGGDLMLTGEDGVSVTGPFSVKLGGNLQLNGTNQYRLKYHYDASGNRVRRRRTQNN